MLLLLKNLLFVIVIPGTVGVYVPLWLARELAAAPGVSFLLALPLFLVGGAIFSWCVWDFATFGRGTPMPLDAPKRLVVRGLYRYSRNPMYVGVLTVILAWAVLYRSPLHLGYALFVATFFHSVVLFYEEPHLRGVFGREYEEYCATVGRWLPRVGGG